MHLSVIQLLDVSYVFSIGQSAFRVWRTSRRSVRTMSTLETLNVRDSTVNAFNVH